MKKNENSGSRSQRSGKSRRRGHRRSAATIERDISQLRAWAQKKTRLTLAMDGEFCPAYLGEITEISSFKPTVSDIFEFRGLGVTVLLLPESWSRSELTTLREEAVLDVYGKRGRPGFTISELSKHGPGTENFRAVLDQLKVWSVLKAKLAVYFFLGPCAPAFVSEVQVDELGRMTFYGNGSFLVVDIRKYDLMKVEVRDQHTEVGLVDCATGTVMQISDVPMSEAQVLERLKRCGFFSAYLM